MIENYEKFKSYGELYCKFTDTYKKSTLHYELGRELLLLIKESNLSLYEKALQEHLDAQKAYIEMTLIFQEMFSILKK